jgi:hypothetical protein
MKVGLGYDSWCGSGEPVLVYQVIDIGLELTKFSACADVL